jgi:DNA-binding NarL/FixJ family response regulator
VPVALAHRPDVALLDIEMPGGDGLTAAAQLHRELPSCKVLILTTFGRPGYLRRAMDAGVVGFLVKDAPASELARAVRRARQLSSSRVASQVAEGTRVRLDPPTLVRLVPPSRRTRHLRPRTPR